MKPINRNDTAHNILALSREIKLHRAADYLGCAIEDLLHLGSIGRIRLFAPVLCKGSYSPDILTDSAFPEALPGNRYYFDASDRVVLRPKDLRKIEAVGWVIPESFWAPTHLRNMDEFFQFQNTAGQERYKRSVEMGDPNEDTFSMRTVLTTDGREQYQYNCMTDPGQIYTEELLKLREHRYHFTYWYASEPQPEGEIQFSERTTVDHLFVSVSDLNALKESKLASLPDLTKDMLGEPVIHKNKERFSSARESVLAFGIYCLVNFRDEAMPNGKFVATDLAKVIDEKSPLLWPSTGEPPLARETVERLLRQAVRIDVTVGN